MILHYKGVFGTFEYSQEDTVYHGQLCVPNDLITYESSTFNGLEFQFQKACADYLETKAKLNKVSL